MKRTIPKPSNDWTETFKVVDKRPFPAPGCRIQETKDRSKPDSVPRRSRY